MCINSVINELFDHSSLMNLLHEETPLSAAPLVAHSSYLTYHISYVNIYKCHTLYPSTPFTHLPYDHLEYIHSKDDPQFQNGSGQIRAQHNGPQRTNIPVLSDQPRQQDASQGMEEDICQVYRRHEE